MEWLSCWVFGKGSVRGEKRKGGKVSHPPRGAGIVLQSWTASSSDSRIVPRIGPFRRSQGRKDAQNDGTENELYEHVAGCHEEGIDKAIVLGREHPFV